MSSLHLPLPSCLHSAPTAIRPLPMASMPVAPCVRMVESVQKCFVAMHFSGTNAECRQGACQENSVLKFKILQSWKSSARRVQRPKAFFSSPFRDTFQRHFRANKALYSNMYGCYTVAMRRHYGQTIAEYLHEDGVCFHALVLNYFLQIPSPSRFALLVLKPEHRNAYTSTWARSRVAMACSQRLSGGTLSFKNLLSLPPACPNRSLTAVPRPAPQAPLRLQASLFPNPPYASSKTSAKELPPDKRSIRSRALRMTGLYATLY